MKKVVVNCMYVVTIPVVIEVEDNAAEDAIVDKATDIADRADLMQEYDWEYYDYEIEG